LGLLFAELFIGGLWLFGKSLARFTLRHLPEREQRHRLLKFNSAVLSRLLLLAYLVYPNISKVVVDMFACRRVGGVDYLVADFRIQCSGARYNSYFGAAIFWTIVFPLGVPAAFLALLLKYDVPRLSARRAQTAWLDAALAGNQAERTERLMHWSTAPGGAESHPREEHLIPLMVASGAGSDAPGRRMWTGMVGPTHLGGWLFE
jgi:hypothetical protein